MKKYLLVFFFTILGSIIFYSCNNNPSTPTEPSLYDKADGVKGGILYDKFWSTEASYSKSADAALIAKLSASSDFFRCKQCHGWDRLGNKGAYINRGPKTNRPNVSGIDLLSLANESADNLFNDIKKSAGRRDISYNLSSYDPVANATEGDKMPNFSQLLSDEEIWNLVKFLKQEALDVRNLYDATYTGTYPTGSAIFSNHGKDGNAVNGKTYYNNNCVSCHGADGKTLPLESMTLGKFVRSKANEAQHKVKFGQLGSSMTAFKTTFQDMKNLYKAVADTVSFPN